MGNCIFANKQHHPSRGGKSGARDDCNINMEIVCETKLQSPRKESRKDDRLALTIQELNEVRKELHQIKRNLNSEIMQFTTSFSQLLSAVHSLASLDKPNKATKRSDRWQVRLQCQCIRLLAVPVAPVTVKLAKLSMLRST